MSNLYSTYSQLKERRKESGLYEVEDFIIGKPHKFGATEDGFPVIFVECCDDAVSTPIRLKAISVDFSQLCTLKDAGGETLTKKYTIIVLNSLEADLQSYFLEVFAMVLNKFSSTPSVSLLKAEISKVAKIFMMPPSFSAVVIQGLWAELFVIANAKSPEDLAKAWHVTAEDKYDFNDGKDKIEVKSTSNLDRVHTFALEQLNPNAGSELAIASVITVRSGQGVNVFDILDTISQRGLSIEQMSKIQEIAYLTIGPHLEEAKKIKYDFTLALNSYMKFDYRDVPSIKSEHVPSDVTSVHFASCLKDVEPIDLSATNSGLLKAM
ncbi:Uncharacterised protein [Prevotella melaninogenica]|uniref:PD-(D/E)XK motif protein n=1 Tax=Prevotella melaninogenica TaxID=28132 RepID=UPI00195EA73B|nr:PD-(D/E)XK motif protein [Prevotella melaninogenica]VTY02507.1 Uncharacterised protein [Prevotella melaninogenica]